MQNPYQMILDRLDEIESAVLRISSPQKSEDVNMEVKEAAQYINHCEHTLRKLAVNGVIKHSRPGRKFIFKKSDLDEFLQSTAN